VKIKKYTVIVIFNKYKWDVFEVMAESKEDAIKDVIEGYLDVPYDFVKDENTEIGIKYEVLEYKLPIQEYKGNNNVEQMDYSNDNYIIKNKSIKFIKGIFNDEIGR